MSNNNDNPVFKIESVFDMRLALYIFNNAHDIYKKQYDCSIDKSFCETLAVHMKIIENWQLSLADRINRIEMNEQ